MGIGNKNEDVTKNTKNMKTKFAKQITSHSCNIAKNVEEYLILFAIKIKTNICYNANANKNNCGRNEKF